MNDQISDRRGVSRRSFTSNPQVPGNHTVQPGPRSPDARRSHAFSRPQNQFNEQTPAIFQELVDKFRNEILKQRQLEASIRASHEKLEEQIRAGHEAKQDEMLTSLMATARTLRENSSRTMLASPQYSVDLSDFEEGEEDERGEQTTVERTIERDSVLGTQDLLHRRNDPSPATILAPSVERTPVVETSAQFLQRNQRIHFPAEIEAAVTNEGTFGMPRTPDLSLPTPTKTPQQGMKRKRPNAALEPVAGPSRSRPQVSSATISTLMGPPGKVVNQTPRKAAIAAKERTEALYKWSGRSAREQSHALANGDWNPYHQSRNCIVPNCKICSGLLDFLEE